MGDDSRERTGEKLESSRRSFARRVLITVGIVALVLSLLALLWYAVDVLLLLFASILLAVSLRGMSDWLNRHTPLSAGWSLAVVVAALIVLAVALVWLLAPRLAAQIDALAQTMPRSIGQLRGDLEQYGWGRWLLAQLPSPKDLASNRADLLAKATGIFSTTLGVILDFIIVLSVGLYLAASPRQYVNGVLRLIPEGRRARAGEVMNEVGANLRLWLLGKILGMLMVGVLTTIGLWLLNVPLAMTFGLLAALLDFIPNIGPLLSVVPALLLALTESPTKALYVLALYVFIQATESYLIIPLLQQRVVSLPPALTIVMQILMGVLLGGLGLALATPFTAAASILVKRLYVEGVLGDRAGGKGS